MKALAQNGSSSTEPSSTPSSIPSSEPGSNSSDAPSPDPSSLPSSMPSSEPSSDPSEMPSDEPSSLPSSMPSIDPIKKSGMSYMFIVLLIKSTLISSFVVMKAPVRVYMEVQIILSPYFVQFWTNCSN